MISKFVASKIESGNNPTIRFYPFALFPSRIDDQ